jgi:hypothetical protein
MVAVQTPKDAPVTAGPALSNADQSAQPNSLKRGLAADLTAIGITASKQSQVAVVAVADLPIQLLKDLAAWNDDKAAFVIKPGANLQYLPDVISYLQECVVTLAVDRACADRLATSYKPSHPEHTFDLQFKVRNGGLEFVIPVHADTAREIAVGLNAAFDAAQACWTVAVDGRSSALIAQALQRIAAVAATAEQTPSLAKTIISPDDRIVLTTDGDKLFVRQPYMPSTSQIMKAAEFVYDHSSASHTAVIKGPTELATATTALAAVVERYDRALMSPTVERRGIEQPPKVVAGLLALSVTDAARLVGADAVLDQAVSRFVNHAVSTVPFNEQKSFEQALT